MSDEKKPSPTDFSLRVFTDGRETRTVKRPPDPSRVSGERVFKAGYQRLLDDPATRAVALDNAERAEAMSTLLGTQDRIFDRLLHRRASGQQKTSNTAPPAPIRLPPTR